MIADLPRALSLSFSNFFIPESTSEARKYGNRIYEISNNSELLILSNGANPAQAQTKVQLTLRATKPVSSQSVLSEMSVAINSSIDLKSALKPKAKLTLKKNEKKSINFGDYIQLNGPVLDLYTSKMKDGKNERLIGQEDVLSHLL